MGQRITLSDLEAARLTPAFQKMRAKIMAERIGEDRILALLMSGPAVPLEGTV